MATRVFNYTPGYPISYGAGSTEKQNSAWSKIVLEIERIYRLISEGFNYFAREIERIDSIIGGSGGSGGSDSSSKKSSGKDSSSAGNDGNKDSSSSKAKEKCNEIDY